MADRSTFALLRDDEREVRRQMIIESTIKILANRPFIDIGVRDIAEEAGVSPASIYRYFSSRNDLLVEALVHQIFQIGHEFNQRVAGNPMAIDDFAEYVVDHLVDNESTFQMMSYLMIVGQMSPKLLEKFNEVQRYFLGEFRHVLEQADVQGDLRIMAQAFFAALAGVTMTYRNYPGRSKDEVRRHMKRLARILALLFKKEMPE